jgi:hypothetical protein
VPRPFPKKISQIKPLISQVALTSHYLVEFGGLPAFLKKYLMQRGMDSRFLGESIGLLACRANLPGSSFATADINGNYMGVNEKFAHTRQFIQMDMDFYVDTDYRSLKFIEHWMEWIASGSTTGQEGSSPAERGYYFRMRYPNEYKCDYTKITKFDKDYKKYIEYRFIGLFPISLNSTSISYEGSQILKASCTFNFERYIAGESYSVNYARGDDGNKTPTSLPELLSRGGSDAFQPRTRLDTGIIPPNDQTIANYSELLSNTDIGGFNLDTTLNSSANFDNAFRIL